MRQGDGSPYMFSIPRKKETAGASIIVNVTRREPRWVSHWKVQNSRFPTIQAGRAYCAIVQDDYHDNGIAWEDFPRRRSAFRRTMQARLVPGKIVIATHRRDNGVATRFASRLTSQCVRGPRRITREDTERRSRSPLKTRFVQGGWEIHDCTRLIFHGCHCTLLRRWKRQPF